MLKQKHRKPDSGMDSGLAFLPDALRVAANLFRTPLCPNPGWMELWKLTVHGTGAHIPAMHDGL